MSKEMKIRLANKRRAQKSRERKNKYTKDLEDKVALLQKQVKLLALQVDKYKRHLAKNKLNIDEVVESTHDQSIIEMMVEQLNSTSNISTFSRRHQAVSSKEGFFGENRMRVIDQAFEVIADHLIPDNYQMSFYFRQEN
jgi:predicted phage tail protein